MAFDAGNILMLSVEFKGSLVVVEGVDLPFLKSMTPCTVCNAVFFKLFLMNVFMAGGAGFRQSCENLDSVADAVLAEVTTSAFFARVNTGKCKGSNAVIKPDPFPCI
jgi:hypothetical protein